VARAAGPLRQFPGAVIAITGWIRLQRKMQG
jgi:hypothetical protein